MARRRRRNVEVFSLSFLDCICCGFGAVILFYTIISAQSGIERIRSTEELSAQVSRLEEEVVTGTRNLVLLRNTLEKTESETAAAASRATQLIERLRAQREELSRYDLTTTAKRERVEQLMADVRALQEATRRLEASAKEAAPRGEFVGRPATFADKRYITGLTLKGRRVLILVDRSASMLSDDLVEIIRLRNQSEDARREAPKWRRARDIVAWVAGQVPQGSQYQIYAYNTDVRAVLAETQGRWLPASDTGQLDRVLAALDGTVPQDGTSLVNALAAIRSLSPAPDQVVLITDGMPTQGATPPALRRFIDAAGRARLFDEAVRNVNTRIPIEIVLLPLRGDLPAAHRFWSLARTTGGNFIMPSRDWP